MIGYYVHHQGSGHLQRAQIVAEHLQTPVTGLSSLAPPLGWRGDWIRLPRDDRPTPSSDADVDAHGRLHWAPLHHVGYAGRMGSVAEWIRTTRPDLMVVDVSVEVTVLARALGVPVTVVCMRGDRSDPAHELAYDLASTLIAPWPERFAEPGRPARWTAKTLHTGAFSRFDRLARVSTDTAEAGVAGSVTCLLGTGGSELSPRHVNAIRSATPEWTWTFCGGDFGPARQPLPDLLRAAQVVVTHAGQNAVAEVAALRRPAVVVSQHRPHGEQRATVDALDRGDLAETSDGWPSPEQWPTLLMHAVERGGARWEEWNDLGGAARFAAAVDESARR